MMRKYIFILAPIVVIGASALLLFRSPRNKQIPEKMDHAEQIVSSPSPVPSDSPVPTHEPVSETNRDESLRIAIMKKYGSSASYTVEILIDGYAQGSLKGQGKQNKWWLAKMANGTWIVVADGYTYVSCADIAPYNFPKTVVPVCWGRNTLVYR